jgi:hypothetical protein
MFLPLAQPAHLRVAREASSAKEVRPMAERVHDPFIVLGEQ